MNKIFLAILLAFGGFLGAQFKIEGEIKNYHNQPIFVRIFTGSSDKIINKVNTDKNGKFSINIPEKYHGIVTLSDRPRQTFIEILSDNENVKLKSDFEGGLFINTVFTEGKTAIGYSQYQDYQSYNDLKSSVFPILKSLYTPKDEFYQAMMKEEARISALSPIADYPLLKYYVQVSELAKANADTKSMAEIYNNQILNRLTNDNENLEASGQLGNLVLTYLRFSILGATSQEQINSILEKEIDHLLDKTDIETPRGQNVLTSVFEVLPKEQFGTLLNKYYSKVEALTCTITDDLKTNVLAHNMGKPGAQVPNIVFDEPIKGFKSLYEVKADKKLVVFWASWCPACMSEMPHIKEYYKTFKKEGGEIIAISLDVDEAAFQEAIKDFGWINYTELMKWETQGVDSYGISGTPSLFLIDKDNKLIKKADHISELMN